MLHSDEPEIQEEKNIETIAFHGTLILCGICILALVLRPGPQMVHAWLAIASRTIYKPLKS